MSPENECGCTDVPTAIECEWMCRRVFNVNGGADSN